MRAGPSFRVRVVTLGAAAALWLTNGALTVASAAPRAPRLGLLPSLLWLLAALAAALLLVRLVPRPGSRLLLLAAAAPVVLPWLPFPVPQAFYIWTSHVAIWLWTLIAAAIVAPSVWTRVPAGIVSGFANPARAPFIAAAIATVAFGFGAWQVSPRLPSGDEPHYLVIAQSLLLDRDLDIENNHARGDYHAFYAAPLRPDYLRRGLDGRIYSIHPIGVALLATPMLAMGGYALVAAFL